jgi:ATP sulfurylase
MPGPEFSPAPNCRKRPRQFGAEGVFDVSDKGGARLLLSGTLLRKLMSEGKPVPPEFSRPEVIAVLKEYYDSLEQKVEVKLHGHATGAAEVK